MPTEIVYAALALVLGWWAARLARSKGSRAPLLWGGLVFVFSLLPRPWNLLGLAPLFLLLFLRPLGTRTASPPRELSCPRCNATHAGSQRYCTGCGWEIERAYPDNTAVETPLQSVEHAVADAPVNTGPTPTASAPEETAPPVEPETSPAAEREPTPEPVLASQDAQVPLASAEGPATEAQEPVSQERLSQETVSPETVSPETEAAAQPQEEAPAAPVFRAPPTAANMTERGIRLFNQGRIQESIDQFTKAIALDANYKEAWEHRAEAYSKLGRSEQAAEDLRRLQAINAGAGG